MKHVIVPEYRYGLYESETFDIDTESLPNNRLVVVLRRDVRLSIERAEGAINLKTSDEQPIEEFGGSYFDYVYDPTNKTDPLYVFRQQPSDEEEEVYRKYLSSFSKTNPKLVLSELVEAVYFIDGLKELDLSYQNKFFGNRRSIPYKYISKLIVPKDGFSTYYRPVKLVFD